MTSNAWHCFCTYYTKEHRCLLHFSIIMSHSVLSGTTVLETRPNIRPRLDQDRGRSDSGLVIRPRVSDPETVIHGLLL